MPCLAHLGEVQEHLEAIRSTGAELIAVSQAAPKVLAVHLEENPRPFPVVGDPDRKAYTAFGLERASWARILGWRSLWKYITLMFRGWRPRRSYEGEDVRQLGGDFIVDARGILVFAYRSADPSDRPSVEELLRQLTNLQSG